MNWLELFVAALTAFIILYLPGCILLSGLRLRLARSVVYAPLLTVFLYSALAIVYGICHVHASFVSLFSPVLGLSLVIFPFSRHFMNTGVTPVESDRENRIQNGTHQRRRLLFFRSNDLIAFLFVLVGLIVAFRFFILPLDGPNSFVQDSDNSFHLALIRSFVDSGNYSPLQTTLYPDSASIPLPLVDTTPSFYPSAWHCLCAMVVSALGTSIPLATNAVNFILIAVVFPLSAYSWLTSLYRDSQLPVICGAFLCLAFCAFPWGAVFPPSGPLYPNLIGFCFLPALCSVFIDLVDRNWSLRRKVAATGLLTIGICSCALAHPNVVFAAAVLLAPFCMSRIYAYSKGRLGMRKAALATGGFFLFVIGCWLIAYFLPAMQSIVRFEWAPFTDLPGAIAACVSLSLRIEDSQQWLVGVLVLIGAIVLMRQKNRLWVVAPWVISCLFFVVCAATDGELENILTGFWYTDPYRVAFLVAISALPLASNGCAAIISIAYSFLSSHIHRTNWAARSLPMTCGIILIPLCFAIFYSSNTAWGQVWTSPFGNIEYSLSAANDTKRNNTLDPDEREFIKEVSEVVDPRYQIYNCADDGSPFGYPLEGLNLCYRRSAAETLKDEKPYAGLLRTRIDQLATNAEVQEILKKSNIRYILVLDMGGWDTPNRCYYGYYWRQKWMGINNINDNTPGLKIILKSKDMRLYEIV